MLFFVGLHQPCDAAKTFMACISINRLWKRVSLFLLPLVGWIMDSGAFTEINKFGRYRNSPAVYAAAAARWVSVQLFCIVAQDYMCEAFVLKKTGLTILEHQRLTIERYDALVIAWRMEWFKAGCPDYWPPIMPVLQGWSLEDYARHVEMYGDRLKPGMWVGVGSVCKRKRVEDIENILLLIWGLRPDLRLHGFGVKLTALRSAIVRRLLYSADSMAWSYSARMQGKNGNDVQHALDFVDKVEALAA
jgi:hypothetical protein